MPDSSEKKTSDLKNNVPKKKKRKSDSSKNLNDKPEIQMV
jgi:hypothetical protein